MANNKYPEYEKLFLIEVFLDSLYIHKASLDIESALKAQMKETCVMFRFLDYPALVLCEEDFAKSQPRNSTEDLNISFKSGKSCIFSIRSSVIPSLPYKFNVEVKILSKVDPPKNKIVLGSANIDLGDSFSAIMHSSVAGPDLPLQKTNYGTFDILDEKSRKIGTLAGLVRLSSFGELIVTQFQASSKQDTFMFKGTDQKQVVEIPGDESQKPKIEVDPNYVPPPKEKVDKPSKDLGDGDADDYDTDMETNRMPPERMGPFGPTMMPIGPPQPPPEEERGNYKEIVAEIRGHSLHIRVPMKQKKPKEICKKQLVEDMEGPICKFAPPLNLCECDYPVPPEAIPRCPPRCPF